MARAHLKMVVQDQLGNVLRSAKVFVWETGTVTPVTDLFTVATGGAAVADAGLVTNTQGEIEGWLSSPRDVALRVTDNGGAAVYAARPTVAAGFSAFTEDPVAVREDPDEERQEDVGFIHVLAWGADPTGAASSTQAFVDAAASANGDLVVGTGTFLLSTNQTIDRHIRFAEGAVLQPANGVTITITGDVDAGLYQIFDLSAGGSVVGMRRTVAEWFGSVADGYAFEDITIAAGTLTTLTINDAGYKLPPSADIVGKTIVVPGAAAGVVATTLALSVVLPASTVSLTDATGFSAAGGMAYVGGQLVKWAGVSGNDLTGCTGGEGTMPSGTPISNVGVAPSANTAYDYSTRLVTTIAARVSDTSLTLTAAAGAAVTNGKADVVGTDNRAAWTRCLAATADGGTMLFGPGIHDAAKGADTGILSVSARRNITVDGIGRARLRWQPNTTNASTTILVHLLNSEGVRLGDGLEVLGSNMTVASVNEQMHAIQVETSRNCDIDCDSAYAFGDGVRYIGTIVGTTVTAAAATDLFTAAAHPLADGTLVTFSVSGGGVLPGGIAASTAYYVVNATVNTFQVATTSGGAAIDLTSDSVATVTANSPGATTSDIRVTGKHNFHWRSPHQFQRCVHDVHVSGESVTDIECSGGPIHAEPSAVGAPTDIYFADFFHRALGGPAKPAMSIESFTSVDRIARWRFSNVHLDGSVQFLRCDDIRWVDSIIEGDPTQVALGLTRNTTNFSYVGGAIRGRMADNPVVNVATISSLTPRDILIDTEIVQLADSSAATDIMGIALKDTSDVTVRGKIVGLGEGIGVKVQNTTTSVGTHRNINVDADIKNFVTAEQWVTNNTATETFEGCRSAGARYDDQAVPTMTKGVEWAQPGAGTGEWVKRHRVACTFGPEVTTPLTVHSTVKYLVLWGNPPGLAGYRVTASPEGVVTASPGSKAVSTAGAEYLKVSGTGNTGWIIVGTGTSSSDFEGKWPAGTILQPDGPTLTLPMVADRAYYTPIWVPSGGGIATAITLETTVAGSGGTPTIRTGIYAADANGQPGALVATSEGTLDASAAPGVKSSSAITATLTQGLYWVVAVAQGATGTQPTIRAIVGASRFVTYATWSASGNKSGYMQNGVSGALLSPAAPVSTNTQVGYVGLVR